MPFDIEAMLAYAEAAINEFASEHASETFYAFAIDADMLCLNSVEEFALTLKEYQDRWDRRTRPIKSPTDMTDEDWRDETFLLDLHADCFGLDRSDKQACVAVINQSRERQREECCEYRTEAGILSLKMNAGDWPYQGFDDLDDSGGFDLGLYEDHYNTAATSGDGHAPDTEYAKAMTELIRRLVEQNAFRPLKRTEDFIAAWVDHIGDWGMTPLRIPEEN